MRHAWSNLLCVAAAFAAATPPPTQPSAHAVHLVFLSEGYTTRASFDADVARLSAEVFTSPDAAFYAVSPLLQIHAVYVPSRESGVGFERAGDTAFRLYREDRTLRSILPSRDSYAKAKRLATAAVPGYNFAVILVNTPFYGGLGDEIAIVSASPTSGAVALRHELGHVFADMGEEYDAGLDYSGRNFAKTARPCAPGEQARLVGGRHVWQCIPWVPWLSDSLLSPPGQLSSSAARGGLFAGKPSALAPIPTERAALHAAEWPWTDLGSSKKMKPYRLTFHTKEDWPRWKLVWSVSGAPRNDSVTISLDGKPLVFHSKGDRDRHFYSHAAATPLARGAHVLHFAAGPGAVAGLGSRLRGGGGESSAGAKSARPRDNPPLMICHVMVWGLGSPSDYHGGAHIGAYPDFDENLKLIGYRATQGEVDAGHNAGAGGALAARQHASRGCIMRDMEAVHFCSICNEALWRSLLAKPLRSPLLHSMTVEAGGGGNNALLRFAVAHAAFGKWRSPTPRTAMLETLAIAWRRDDVAIPSLDGANSFTRQLAMSNAAGCWSVRVTLRTSDVRASDAAMKQLLTSAMAVCVGPHGEVGKVRAGKSCGAHCAHGAVVKARARATATVAVAVVAVAPRVEPAAAGGVARQAVSPLTVAPPLNVIIDDVVGHGSHGQGQVRQQRLGVLAALCVLLFILLVCVWRHRKRRRERKERDS